MLFTDAFVYYLSFLRLYEAEHFVDPVLSDDRLNHLIEAKSQEVLELLLVFEVSFVEVKAVMVGLVVLVLFVVFPNERRVALLVDRFVQVGLLEVLSFV